jgi:hypothetical protein
MSRLTNRASIGAISPELEGANSEAQATIFIGRRIYLPLIARSF